jgi:hypothetical protein
MSDLAAAWFAADGDDRDDEQEKKASVAGETPAGHQQSVQWKSVATAPGVTAASIIAGRLQAADIPVRVWQEAVGQVYGLVVGALGTAHVVVPAEYVEAARQLLDERPSR